MTDFTSMYLEIHTMKCILNNYLVRCRSIRIYIFLQLYMHIILLQIVYSALYHVIISHIIFNIVRFSEKQNLLLTS